MSKPKVTQLVVGAEYEFATSLSLEPLLRGRVVEMVDNGRTARVRLTEPSWALDRLARLGEPVPGGEILRVFLALVTATKVEAQS